MDSEAAIAIPIICSQISPNPNEIRPRLSSTSSTATSITSPAPPKAAHKVLTKPDCIIFMSAVNRMASLVMAVDTRSRSAGSR